jgi:GntR family transcriptional regulator/MocR family aminotransferase
MSRPRATDLLIRLDPRAGRTRQRQIYDGIRRAILDGVARPGAKLRSSRDLALDLGVSRTTTLLAYDQLTAEGYLTARQGSGTFVSRELPDDRAQAARIGTGPHDRHPPPSRRALALAAVPPTAIRVTGPPCAFRLGTPAFDLFPIRQWTRLVHRRLASATRRDLDYGPFAGIEALREAIADYVQSARGTRCGADQVIIVAGSKPGLSLITRLLIDPGDAVWMEEPGFPGARGSLIDAGAQIVPVPVDRDGLVVDAGMRRARHARLAYVTPSHQFPLGIPMSLPRRLELIAWARAARAWIVEDDYDSEFRYGAHAVPCLHGLDADGRVIYIGSFSKTLFPALRLGFLIVPADLRETFVAARRGIDNHPPTLDQMVLADFMAGGHFERHLRRMRAAYRERLEAMTAAAARYCAGALTIRPVRTGLHAVGDLHGAAAAIVAREAAAREVEVMPVSAYFAGRPKDAAAVRDANALVLGFGSLPPGALIEGMQRLAAAIDAASGTKARAATRVAATAAEAAAAAAAAVAENEQESSAPRRRAAGGRR